MADNTKSTKSNRTTILSCLAALAQLPEGVRDGELPITNAILQSYKKCVADGQQDIELMANNYARLQNVWGFGFWEWDFVTKKFQILSSHLWKSMGYSMEEVNAISNVEQAMHYVHENDKIAMALALKNHKHNDTAFEHSFRVRNKNGSYRWIQARAASLRNENKDIFFMAGVNYDITNEKFAEQSLRDNQSHFQRILKSTNDGIWEWSRKEGRLSFSQGCWRLLGFNVEDIEMGVRRHRLWRARVHSQDRSEFDLAMTLPQEQGGEIDVEYRIKNINNEWIWIRSRGDVIYDEEGEVEFLAGANIDITELKRSEERLISAKSLAEQANKAKSEFLSSMSHELRTPMNAIIGFTQLFDYADNITEEQRENINEIKKSGRRLLELITDVLELSRIEAGKFKLSLESVAIGPLVDEVFQFCKASANSVGVNLNFEPHHLANAYVKADKNGLKQAIINLITYGIYNNRPGGRVIVSLADTANSFLVISVRDNGRGIPRSYQTSLFEPFGRKIPESQDSPTSGIGLAICKRLVELMAGNLQFDSEEGVGTCFQIQLPLERKEKNMETPIKLIEKEIIVDSNFRIDADLFATKQFLYIEDNAANIRLLEQYFAQFRDLDFQVADESVRGLFQARSSIPDLIILDINMPGIDGFEVLTILRSDPSTADIPVIALSANATNEDIQRALDAGFTDYLTKPVDVEQLTMVINSLVY